MGLKPIASRWFEALVTREGLARAIEALARSGAVELEPPRAVGDGEAVEALREQLERCEAFAHGFRRYLPEAGQGTALDEPARALEDALERMRAWAEAADPTIETIEELEHEQDDLELLGELLQAAEGPLPDLRSARRAGPVLAVRLFAASPDQPEPRSSSRRRVFRRRIEGKRRVFVLVAGLAREVEALQEAFGGAGWRSVTVPHWLDSPVQHALARLETRLRETRRRNARERRRLRHLAVAHGVPVAVADLQRIRWFLEHVPSLPTTRSFVRITGWTTDADGEQLRAGLARAGIPAVLGLVPPPADRDPPVLLRNSWWARPFEAFARLLGTPARDEIDPSAPLSIVAPLLFGFMFGDVGQGLVVLGTGLVLRRRFSQAGILVPAGAAAVFFGFLFGSAWAQESLIPALWLHPLEQPVTVLAASVILGVAILVLGLALQGLAAYWRGRIRSWLATDAAVVVIYVGLLASLLEPWIGVLVAGGAVWHGLGASMVADPGRRVGAFMNAQGRLLERVLQLGVNTISFARVGAFSLAHAGLSAAIVGVASAVGQGWASVAVLVSGNVLAIALEGLVVSIQATRLILFEFFVRFLRAEGRAFRPLPAPGALAPTGGGV